MRKDDNYSEFTNFDELMQLRYLVDKFKRYDKKRQAYLRRLENMCENYRGKIKEYKKQTERMHDEIDELINSYENAKPLLAHPGHKAYVYELLKRIDHFKAYKPLYIECKEQNALLSERIKKLEMTLEGMKGEQDIDDHEN